VPLEPGETFVAHDIDYLPSSNPSITDEPEHTDSKLHSPRVPTLRERRQKQRSTWKRKPLKLPLLLIFIAALVYMGNNLRIAAMRPALVGECPPHFMHRVSDLDDLNPLIGLPPRLFLFWGAPETLLAKPYWLNEVRTLTFASIRLIRDNEA
jgi:hypothetical protein